MLKYARYPRAVKYMGLSGIYFDFTSKIDEIPNISQC
jgi:hypothetical protein